MISQLKGQREFLLGTDDDEKMFSSYLSSKLKPFTQHYPHPSMGLAGGHELNGDLRGQKQAQKKQSTKFQAGDSIYSLNEGNPKRGVSELQITSKVRFKDFIESQQEQPDLNIDAAQLSSKKEQMEQTQEQQFTTNSLIRLNEIKHHVTQTEVLPNKISQKTILMSTQKPSPSRMKEQTPSVKSSRLIQASSRDDLESDLKMTQAVSQARIEENDARAKIDLAYMKVKSSKEPRVTVLNKPVKAIKTQTRTIYQPESSSSSLLPFLHQSNENTLTSKHRILHSTYDEESGAKQAAAEVSKVLHGPIELTETFLGPSNKVKELKKRIENAEKQRKDQTAPERKWRMNGRRHSNSSHSSSFYSRNDSSQSNGRSNIKIDTMPSGIVDYRSKILVSNKVAVVRESNRFKPTSSQKWETGGRIRQEMEKRAQGRMNALKQLKKSNYQARLDESGMQYPADISHKKQMSRTVDGPARITHKAHKRGLGSQHAKTSKAFYLYQMQHEVRRNKKSFSKTTGMSNQIQSFGSRDSSGYALKCIEQYLQNETQNSERSLNDASLAAQSDKIEIAELRSDALNECTSRERMDRVQLFKELKYLASWKGRKLSLDGVLPREKQSGFEDVHSKRSPNFLVTNCQSARRIRKQSTSKISPANRSNEGSVEKQQSRISSVKTFLSVDKQSLTGQSPYLKHVKGSNLVVGQRDITTAECKDDIDADGSIKSFNKQTLNSSGKIQLLISGEQSSDVQDYRMEQRMQEINQETLRQEDNETILRDIDQSSDCVRQIDKFDESAPATTFGHQSQAQSKQLSGQVNATPNQSIESRDAIIVNQTSISQNASQRHSVDGSRPEMALSEEPLQRIDEYSDELNLQKDQIRIHGEQTIESQQRYLKSQEQQIRIKNNPLQNSVTNQTSCIDDALQSPPKFVGEDYSSATGTQGLKNNQTEGSCRSDIQDMVAVVHGPHSPKMLLIEKSPQPRMDQFKLMNNVRENSDTKTLMKSYAEIEQDFDATLKLTQQDFHSIEQVRQSDSRLEEASIRIYKTSAGPDRSIRTELFSKVGNEMQNQADSRQRADSGTMNIIDRVSSAEMQHSTGNNVSQTKELIIERNCQSKEASQDLLEVFESQTKSKIKNNDAMQEFLLRKQIRAASESISKVNAFKLPTAKAKGDFLPALEKDLKDPESSNFKNLSKLFQERQKEKFYEKNARLARKILRSTSKKQRKQLKNPKVDMFVTDAQQRIVNFQFQEQSDDETAQQVSSQERLHYSYNKESLKISQKELHLASSDFVRKINTNTISKPVSQESRNSNIKAPQVVDGRNLQINMQRQKINQLIARGGFGLDSQEFEPRQFVKTVKAPSRAQKNQLQMNRRAHHISQPSVAKQSYQTTLSAIKTEADGLSDDSRNHVQKKGVIQLESSRADSTSESQCNLTAINQQPVTQHFTTRTQGHITVKPIDHLQGGSISGGIIKTRQRNKHRMVNRNRGTSLLLPTHLPPKTSGSTLKALKVAEYTNAAHPRTQQSTIHHQKLTANATRSKKKTSARAKDEIAHQDIIRYSTGTLGMNEISMARDGSQLLRQVEPDLQPNVVTKSGIVDLNNITPLAEQLLKSEDSIILSVLGQADNGKASNVTTGRLNGYRSESHSQIVLNPLAAPPVVKQSIPMNQIPILIVDKKRQNERHQMKSLRQRKIMKYHGRRNSSDQVVLH